jgi:hypothetical protein
MVNIFNRGMRKMANAVIKNLGTCSIFESAIYGNNKIVNKSKQGSIIESKVFGEQKKKNVFGNKICGKI